MANATFPLPNALQTALTARFGPEGLSTWGVEAMVLQGVREGFFSVGEVGEILGLGYFQAEAFLKAKGVPVVLSDEEFENDQADLREIVARSKRA